MEVEPTVAACMLPTADHKDRLAWIEELNASALRNYCRHGSRIELDYHPAAVARVRELVHREKECCPFLDFTLREEEDTCTLVIEAPGHASAAADALFAPYSATRHSGEMRSPHDSGRC